MKVTILGLTLVGMLGAAASRAPTPIYSIETVAGSSVVGDGGPAITASLSDVEGVAVDSAGNVFVADTNDHRIRKVAPDGTVSTVAGDGFPGFGGDGGPASAARLNTPYGVALDGAGNLFIADLGNNRVRKVSPDGTISTVPGTENLVAPRNVALDRAGTLYISEFGGHRVWRLRPDGVVESVVGNGTPGFAGDGGIASAAKLSYPAGLAFDTTGALYIADSSNHRVRKVAAGVITTVLGSGDPGAALPNQLNLPTSVAIDSAGDLYVADSGNQRIQFVSATGTITTLPGTGRDLALDRAGNLFLGSGSHLLEIGTDLSLRTIAGDGSYGYRGDGGAATSARLNGPVALAFSAAGTLYIADQKNLRVRAVDSKGVITTALGDGTAGSAPNQLGYPAGVAVGPSGAIFVSDQNNDRIQVMTAAGDIQTLAGTGAPGFNGDGLPAASTQLFSPGAMTISGDGTLYFADAGNGRVRNVNTAGIVNTIAPVAARGVAVDGAGNVYCSDGALHRIMRIDLRGGMSILAGTGAPGFAGDGGPASAARVNTPGGLAVDEQGNLYVSDTGNNRIRMIAPDGTIHTIAGNGMADFADDAGPALSASLNAPAGLTIDDKGNIWIADTGNNRIRKLTPGPIAVEQIQALAIVNAASMQPGPVAPGEIVSIFGLGIGPVAPTGTG
jgi:sugar lactone lactonase YvrE